MVYTENSDFDWDDANVEHIARHGIKPEEAEETLLDPRRFVYRAAAPTEQRHIAVGMTTGGRLLAVVFTIRRRSIRVATAREAVQWERRQYRRRS